jgi:tetratricopeptide (TPR) repeat protein
MEDGLEHPLLPSLRAMLEAMRGRFDDARSFSAQARARCEELGDDVRLAFLGQTGFIVEMCAGEPAAAERAVREGCELLEQMGERGYLSTQAGQLGRALCAQARYDEAEEWSRKSAELGASDDVYTQALWRQVRGTVLAYRGDFAEAERLMREALDLIEQTDMLNEHADARMDLAEMLELGGRRDEAAEEVQRALALYERKGNVATAEQARARLERLV